MPDKVKEALQMHADKVSKDKQGNYTARRGYFYTNGNDEHKYANRVSSALNEAGIKHEVVDKGNVYKAFKGGAPVERQSHFYVKVKPYGSGHDMAQHGEGKPHGGAA